MKKIKYLILVFILCLVFSNMTLAVSLKDVKGTKYEDAVNMLIEVGLVNGYEDNTYRPNVVVTRSQMAKLMVIALGEEGRVSSASKKATTFTDMKTSHWAYGYVNVAKDIGVINGYTDGSFDPDATVSYAEAVTMVVRALGYEPKVQQSASAWPVNYIECAKELSLFNDIGTFNNASGAARGDIAILMWNMLNTGVCSVTAQNNKGLVYGQGEKMLSKYKDFIYMNDGEITAVNFDDDYENATVTIEGKDKIKLSMSDKDVFQYFGKTLTIFYNTKTKKILSIEGKKNYSEDSGSITKLTSKKIYIDKEEYTLPSKSNIILYKAESLSEAIEAKVYVEGKTVKYVLASGSDKVDFGLVTEKNVKVNKIAGIKMKRIGVTQVTSYALIEGTKMPNKYSVIAYYKNSDDEIGIIQEIDVDDAKDISSLTSSKIKIGKNTYTYDSDKFEIYAITATTIKSMTFKNIDEDDDLVYVFEHGGMTYLIVFRDAANNESNKSDLYSDLKSYIKDVKENREKESYFSQDTYAEFVEKLTDAEAIKSTDSVSQINGALEELKTAYNNLKTVTSGSTEGKIAIRREALREMINNKANAIVKEKDKYTSTTYNTFNSALIIANKTLSETDNTLAEAEDAYDNLEEAIDKLELITNTQEYKNALAELEAAIGKCDKVLAKDSYTADSYAKYEKAYNTAISAQKNAANLTVNSIKNATSELNTAIGNLELAIEAYRNQLNQLIVDSIDIANDDDDFFPKEFNAFEKAYEKAIEVSNGNDLNAIKDAYSKLKETKNNLKLVDDVLSAVTKEVESMKDAQNVAEALNMTTQKSSDKIDKIEAIKKATKQDLEDLIDVANEKASKEGASGDGSLNIAIGNAKKVLVNTSSTYKEYVNAYNSLKKYVA